MDLYEVMRITHAVREFTDEPLPDDTLYRILDNARFAPAGATDKDPTSRWCVMPTPGSGLPNSASPGARRYIAQLVVGENPWNPVHSQWRGVRSHRQYRPAGRLH